MSTAAVLKERPSLLEASSESTDIGFGGAANFALTLRVADCLSKSSFVPTVYQGDKGLPNCIIALEIANRLGISWLAVMQNLYVVHGRPAWMSTFVIAAVNGCGRFNSLRFDMTGNEESRQCIAWTTEKSCPIPANIRTLADAQRENLPILEGAPIAWKMVLAEGWASKPGSKWQTMPEQMFRYRAAAFWGRIYAPELLMGIVTNEEAEDIGRKEPPQPTNGSRTNGLLERLNRADTPPPTEQAADSEPSKAAEPLPESTAPAKPDGFALDELRAECRRTGISEADAAGRVECKNFAELDAMTAEMLLADLRTEPAAEAGQQPGTMTLPERIAKVREACKATGTKEIELTSRYNVPSLARLTDGQADDAIKYLATKKAK